MDLFSESRKLPKSISVSSKGDNFKKSPMRKTSKSSPSFTNKRNTICSSITRKPSSPAPVSKKDKKSSPSPKITIRGKKESALINIDEELPPLMIDDSHQSSNVVVSKSKPSQVSKSKPSQVSNPKSSQVSKSKQSQVSDPKSSQDSDSKSSQVSDPKSSQVSKSKPSQVSDPKSSRVSDPKPSQVSDPKSSQVSDPKPSQVSDPKPSQVSDPKSSQVSDPKQSQVSDPKSSQVSDPKSSQVSDPKSSQVSDPKQSQVSDPKQSQVSDPKPSQVSKSKPSQVSKSKPSQVSKSKPFQVSDPEHDLEFLKKVLDELSITKSPSPKKSPPSPITQKIMSAKKMEQKLHLVLDLDATLVSSKEDMKRFGKCEEVIASISDPIIRNDLESRIIQFSCGGTKMWTILRPLAVEFIEFACCYFRRISIWSAGQKDYVDSIVHLLFPSHVPKPTIVFTWKDCIQQHNDVKDGNDSEQFASPSNQTIVSFTKPIKNIANLVGDDVKNMLILDDRKDIATQNMNNLIHVPPFDPKLTLKSLTKEDSCLDQFIGWLMSDEVIQSLDIRTVEKCKIFSE